MNFALISISCDTSVRYGMIRYMQKLKIHTGHSRINVSWPREPARAGSNLSNVKNDLYDIDRTIWAQISGIADLKGILNSTDKNESKASTL